MTVLLLLVFALPAAAQNQVSAGAGAATKSAVAPASSVDLTSQFPTAATRDQGSTNACHVFSTIALLEAALHRRYGYNYPLSEADLFVRKIVEDPGYYTRVRDSLASTTGISPAYSFIEAGNAIDDMKFAIKYGVAKAATAPWPDFESRYQTWQSQQKQVLSDKDDAVVESAAARNQVQSDYDKLGAQEASGQMDAYVGLQRQVIHRADARITQRQLSAKKDFLGFIAQIEGATKAQADQLLLGGSPQLTTDRNFFRTMLTGFTVGSWFFAQTNDPPGDKCRTLGADRKKALLATFARSIPASLSMSLDGLPGWGANGSHSFVVTGYDTDAQGRIVLKSRNSWGGDNPSVPEAHFCRIARIIVAKSDKE